VKGVILDTIETTDVVELEPELVAVKAWEELRFTPMLEALGMNPSAIATGQLMVSNLLIEPLSEWALIDWSYRTSDDLMARRKDRETDLRQRKHAHFSLSRSVILSDVTNSHFKGFCASNHKAKHGKNKQHRNDCRQIAVGSAFDEYRFSLAHEAFEGNIADDKKPAAHSRSPRPRRGISQARGHP
jgi:hypothetical protein